jgi:hypothetical protein
MVVVGLGFLVGLSSMLLALVTSSAWGVLHNNLGLFLVGFLCVYGAPLWLLTAVGLGLRRRGPWHPYEVVLIAAVAATLGLTVYLMA